MEKGGGKIEKLAIITQPLNENELMKFAKNIGDNLVKGDLVLLKGDLGSDKTTFVKGLAFSLGIDMKTVSSPTFTILNVYKGKVKLYHMDLYRLNDINEFIEAGLEEFLSPEDGITVVEWPDIIKSIRQNEFLEIIIEFVSIDFRRLKLIPRGEKYEQRFLRGENCENVKD